MSEPSCGPPSPSGEGRRPVLLVGLTGASGAPYAVRLVERAVRAGGRRVCLIATRAGRMVLAEEGDLAAAIVGGAGPGAVGPTASVPGAAGIATAERPASPGAAEGRERGPRAPLAEAEGLDPRRFWPGDVLRHLDYHPAERLDGPPASGSFRAEAMVVVPCSMNTLAALAHGLAGNLLLRAAQVALKEGRPLVLVPREMPVTPIDLVNMVRLARAGAVVMPAMPGFYHRPRTVAEVVDFVVAKVLDRLGVPHGLEVGWPGAEAED